MPEGFSYPYGAELWRPWTFDRDNGRQHFLNAQARLKPGVTRAQAQAELDTISQRLAQEFPETNSDHRILLRPTRESLLGNNDRVILLVLVAVGFVLLIACANVANLLLARSVSRQKEFAIRAALGASRVRQLRQLLTENILLSLLGGTLGVLFALWASDFLLTLIPPRMSSLTEKVPIDTAVLGFTLLVSVIIGAAVGLVPAFRTSRLDLQSALKEGGRASGLASRHGLLRGLVVAEIALALVLLTGAALMAQNFYRLQKIDLGFSPENLLSMQIALPEDPYAEPLPRINLVQQALERIQALPGVVSAGVVNIFPLTDGNQLAGIILEGQPEDPEQSIVVNHRLISPGYFAMMKIPLLRGQVFTDQDSGDSQPVVVISQSMARRFWPGQDPIGKRARLAGQGEPSPWLTVVGVVGDVVQPRIGDEAQETWYLPYAQSRETSTVWTVLQFYLGVRTAGETTGVVESVRRAIGQVDATLPVYNVLSLGDVRSNFLRRRAAHS
jgi:putative ABC transport system permease protein